MNPSYYACPGAPCALTVFHFEVSSGKVEGTTGTLSVLLPTQQLILSRSYIWVMIPQQSPDNGSVHYGGIGHTLLFHIQTPECRVHQTQLIWLEENSWKLLFLDICLSLQNASSLGMTYTGIRQGVC